MRVLVVASTFPNAEQPTRGTFVWERVRRLAARCEVEVVAPIPWFPLNGVLRRDRDGVPPREEREGITVHHPRFVSLPRVGKSLDGVLYGRSLVPFVRRLRARFPFDVIDAHFEYPDGMGAVIIARACARPVVVSIRGKLVRLSRSRLHRPLLRWTFRHATRVTAVSRSLRDLAGQIGAAADRIRVIPNGVDTKTFRAEDRAESRRALGLPVEGPLLLTVAAIYAHKGQHTVVESLPALAARFPGVAYVMVGAGWPGDPYPRRLRDTAARLGVSHAVRFAGSQPHAGLAPWFSAADLFVLPTLSEGRPNSVLEALACGTPVVATDVGGVGEIVRDGVDGYLVPYGDAEAFRGAVARALSRPWDRRALVARAAEFDWADTVEMALGELQAAVEGRP
jgi:glycosyltransferase involved in cell wall biosynthesis